LSKASDRDYYLARIAAERQAAESATNEAAREAHLQLAERYEQRVSNRGRRAANES
jgi:hypothetical protein